jgi:hypothetical protein
MRGALLVRQATGCRWFAGKCRPGRSRRATRKTWACGSKHSSSGSAAACEKCDLLCAPGEKLVSVTAQR